MADTRGEKINFLKQFKDERSLQLHKLSSVQFMEVWMHYDKDGKENIDISGITSLMEGENYIHQDITLQFNKYNYTYVQGVLRPI